SSARCARRPSRSTAPSRSSRQPSNPSSRRSSTTSRTGQISGTKEMTKLRGAVTDNLYGINGKYAKFGEVEPPQLDAVTKNTIIATLSMGGNDANFSDILNACAEAFVNGWIAT